jgi:hypothetical protein
VSQGQVPTTRGRPSGRCEPGRVPAGAVAVRVLTGVLGLAVVVVGIIVDPSGVPLGPLLIGGGLLVLLVGVLRPWVDQIQIGPLSVASVTLRTPARDERVRRVLEDYRGLIGACAAHLCSSSDSATRVVETSVSRAVADWRGSGTDGLFTYVLCVMVGQVRFEALAEGSAGAYVAGASDSAFRRLPFEERVVLVLTDRAGLDDAQVGRILGVAAAEVAELRTRALTGLVPGGTS